MNTNFEAGESSLPEAITAICKLTGTLEKKAALRTGTEEAEKLKSLLYNARNHLQATLKAEGKGSYQIKVGTGNGYVPRVPWIFISKTQGPVSSNHGLAICFGRQGNGIVVGEMFPIGEERGQTTRQRRKNDPEFIDVDGDSIVTRYNNRFVSPNEVFVGTAKMRQVETIIKSLIKSL